MTGAGEPRREEPPPPSAGLRSRESGARSAGGWERAERGRGAAARPATGPPPRRIGPLYGMWLVTFLLLLDSLHKGETRAGSWAAEAAELGCARLATRQGCPAGSRCPGADPGAQPGTGVSGWGKRPVKIRVRLSLGLLCQPPEPAVLGRVRGLVATKPLISSRGRSSTLDPSPSPSPTSCSLLAQGPQGALRVGIFRPRLLSSSPRLLEPRTRAAYSFCTSVRPSAAPTPALARMRAQRVALIRALAVCNVVITGGPESWGPLDSKFVLQAQGSPCPNPPPDPLAPGASPGFAALPPWPPQAMHP